MKALAIDTAISKISIAARNGDKTVSETYDIGMRQSEILLPAIISVMGKCALEVKELDFLSISQGPGSFTGLRIGYASMKAIEFAADKPLFSYSELDVYAEPFLDLPFIIISAMDAHMEKFYLKAFDNGKCIIEEGDHSIDNIMRLLEGYGTDKDFLVVGPDSEKLKSLLESGAKNIIRSVSFSCGTTDILLNLAEKDFLEGKTGIKDYDGPVYIRKSEAEENLASARTKN